MTVSTIVGKCPICEINIYDRGELNKPFNYLGKVRKGYPNDLALPCGINRTGQDSSGDPVVKEMSKEQFGLCPFESKEEQALIEYKKGLGVISGENTWEGIV